VKKRARKAPMTVLAWGAFTYALSDLYSPRYVRVYATRRQAKDAHPFARGDDIVRVRVTEIRRKP
jgi:hypothetical protein